MDRKELIEKARELLACGALSKDAADAIKRDFPELAESEDERIRKRIKGLIYHNDALLDKDELLAWLEKQKTTNEEGDFARGYNCGYECCLHSHGAEWFEKQKEQKPNIELIQRSWYMEGYHDREFGKEPKWIIKTGEGGPKHELNPKYGEYIKKEQKPNFDTRWENGSMVCVYKQKEQKPGEDSEYRKAYLDGWNARNLQAAREQKPAGWSEEDEKQIAQIERIVKNAGCAKMLQDKIHNWLKSLRPQQKQEWGKEDWELLQEIRDYQMSLIGSGPDFSPNKVREGIVELIDRLMTKQPPQPQWKPSEEQKPIVIQVENPNIQKLDPNVIIETRTNGTGEPYREPIPGVKKVF